MSLTERIAILLFFLRQIATILDSINKKKPIDL